MKSLTKKTTKEFDRYTHPWKEHTHPFLEDLWSAQDVEECQGLLACI